MSDDSVRLGWWLSSEELDPRRLVTDAVRAESIGCPTAMISDHLRPWVRRQGQASHVWSVVGAIMHATSSLELGTGVVSMVHRNHPVAVAQAAATAAVMSEDRFFLGVGTGERLNEQALGERWPSSGERLDRLVEAVEVIRRLWSGESVNHRGESWNVEKLSLFTRPATAPPVYVAASGKRSAAVAGEHGDGMIAVAADHQLVEVFRGSGGTGKPCVAQLHVSLADSKDGAVDNAWEWWPHGVVPPTLLGELSQPQEFEAAASAIGRNPITDTVVCTTDAGDVVAAIDRFVAAGFDTVYLHQVGEDQDRLAEMLSSELLPHYASG
ncbi:MAG TPA: TIGR03557 family F420-dependent LLM class oxidoreductase [Ilumatobacteraceae bacterium]